MKALVLLAGLMMVSTTHAEEKNNCYAYGRSYTEGEQDCDGRVCGKDGVWTGVVKSGVCDVTGDDTGRDPASVGKKHKKKKHKPAKPAGSH